MSAARGKTAHTVFYALDIDDLMATDRQGRPFRLMEEGRPLVELV